MKIKFLFVPRYEFEDNRKEKLSPPVFPPLSISTLTQFLRKQGFNVDQDDLSIKLRNYNNKEDSLEKIKLNPFFDKGRVEDFLENKHDPLLEREGEKIIALTKCKGYDVFGFSSLPSDNISVVGTIAVLAKLLKEKYGSYTVINSTYIEESARNKLLKSELIDYEILSSTTYSVAEIGLCELLEHFEGKRKMEDVRGLRFLENGKIIGNPKFNDFDSEEKSIFTRPDFDGLPINLYKKKLACKLDNEIIKKEVNFLPYFFIRGCPNKCAFCHYSTKPFIGCKKPKEVVEDLEILSENYDIKNFFFLNTEINPSYSYAESIAEEIIESDLNISWTDCATFNNLDKNLLKKLERAGAIKLVFGLESPSKKMLDYINKPSNLDQAERILKDAYDVGIMSMIDIVVGIPYERREDVNQGLSFLRKNKGNITDLNLNKFYLDGMFLKFPRKYKIKAHNKEGKYRNYSSRPFEEINGLKWEERLEVTNELFNKYEEFRKNNLEGEYVTHKAFFIGNNPELKRFLFKNNRLPKIKEISE